VPHQLSDYVVIAPHDMNLSITKRHWERRFPEESFEEFAPAHGAGTITYRWIARDARQIQPETNHDHVSTILPNIEIGRGRTWHDLNAEMLDMFLGRFRQTEAIGAEAADAVAGADDVEAKARAVFRHVNALVKSDAPVYDANKILHAKAGNRGVLLAAMLQAAGIDARFAVARPRAEAIAPSEGPGEPTWALPSAAYFADTFVCVLTGDGERIWLDPEGPYSAFNVLPARYHGGVALILDDDGGTLTTLPWGPLREQGHTTKTSISFDVAANTAVGSRTLVVSGAAAGTYKRLFAESSSHWRDTWAENALSTAVAGARLTSVQAYGLDDPAEPFSVTSVFDLADALTGTAPDREVPTGLERLHLTKRFVGEPARVYPLKISSPLVAWDEISLKTDVSSVWVCPPPLTEHTAFGSYSLTSVSRGAAVDIKRSIALVPQVIDPARYEEFVRFCRRIDAAETASLRIRPAAPAGK
jgi:hypothetical protein